MAALVVFGLLPIPLSTATADSSPGADSAAGRSWTPPALDDMGTLGGDSSVAYAVNDAGIIVGESTQTAGVAARAFIAGPGTATMYPLGHPAEYSRATAVAGDGTIAGTAGHLFPCDPVQCPDQGFLYDSAAPSPVIQNVPLVGADRGTIIRGVNSAGHAVGEMDMSDLALYWFPHAAVYEASRGVFVDLGTLGNGIISNATAISEHGVVVGATQVNVDFSCMPIPCAESHAFSNPYTSLLVNGPMADLGTLGGTNSIAYAVNEHGVVVGASDIPIEDGGGSHAFVYDPADPGMVDLGTLGGAQSWAYGINDDGWVVGSGQIEGNTEAHAFAYDPVAHEMHDLGTLGGTSSTARDISNCGVIVGSSLNDEGEMHAFRAGPVGFSDMSATNPFLGDVCWLTAHGIAAGYLDGTFRPAETITRQAAVAWLHRLAGSPAPPFPPTIFPDVGPGHPFANPIAWALESGLVSGYPDGLFRPGAPVSRQALIVWLWRLAGSPAGPFPVVPFTDVSPGPFATAIAWAASVGVGTGYADGTFRPTAPITRQAAAAFFHRAAPFAT